MEAQVLQGALAVTRRGFLIRSLIEVLPCRQPLSMGWGVRQRFDPLDATP